MAFYLVYDLMNLLISRDLSIKLFESWKDKIWEVLYNAIFILSLHSLLPV